MFSRIMKAGLCILTALSVMAMDSSFSSKNPGTSYSDEAVIEEENQNIGVSLISEVSAASTVRLSRTKKTIYKGRSYTLKMKGTSRKAIWSSSNKKVATVNSKGKVTAKKKGTATITAKVGGKKYKCKVTVKNISPKISSSSRTIYKGRTSTLKVSGTPDTPKWSSSNRKVATVSSSGKVTAKKKGTATISAKVNGKTLKCKVTVKNISPKISSSSATLAKGKTTTLKVSGTPDTPKWSSGNKSVATVSSKGKVTAKKAGTATISAKVNGKTLKCKVTVKNSIPITKVSLSNTSIDLTTGAAKTLTATVSPSNTTRSKTVSWSSSKESVATVSSSGKVTAKKAGTATITATTSNGKTKTCKVYVNDKVSFTDIASPITQRRWEGGREVNGNYYTVMTDSELKLAKQLIKDFKGKSVGYSKTYSDIPTPTFGNSEWLNVPQVVVHAVEKTLDIDLSLSNCNRTFTIFSKGGNDIDSLAYDALKSAGVTSGMNRKTAVKKINAWMCKNITYESGQDDVYTAFTKKKANCSGYALMFNAMCRRAGIESIDVIGQSKSSGDTTWGGHEWNKVKLDGKWYYIDVCWNDTGGSETRYYLSSSLWDNHRNPTI